MAQILLHHISEYNIMMLPEILLPSTKQNCNEELRVCSKELFTY